jgi:tetratricopeptide (TPR) repeat protein
MPRPLSISKKIIEQNMTLQFEVFDNAGTFAYPDRSYDGLISDLSELQDDLESGRLRDKAYLAAIDRMLAAAPELMHGHMYLAHHWNEQGKPKKALDAALKGLAVANRHIPEGFAGLIEWGHLENRAYLRLLNLALQSYLRLNRHRDALLLITLMLERNPGDNQGVRYLLGSEALRCGEHEIARTAFAVHAHHYPPNYYELALSFILTGEWVAAATALRRGFVANPYIAEMLGGNPEPQMLPIWHASNLAEPETAADYVHMYGTFWFTAPGSLLFTRWLFNHSKVMVERVGILECKEAMLSARDVPARSKIIEQEARLTAAIDDTISKTIVVKRKDEQGQACWPWSLE